MQAREIILEELTETLNNMILSIEEREAAEPDFAVVRELAEQLKEEVEALYD